MNNVIILNVPYRGEISLNDVCEKEYDKLCSLLYTLENEFNIDMSEHKEIRKQILDSANFINRIPTMISDVIKVGDNH